MIDSKQQNQVNRYLIKTNQTVEKDLIEFIFEKQSPSIKLDQILSYDNDIDKQLIGFIPQQMKKQFKKILQQVYEFKLTTMGTYYGSINEKQYIAFSECILMYGKKLNQGLDNGFIYLKGKNCYVGQVKKGKSHETGQLLYFQNNIIEDQQEKTMELKIFFQGIWNAGNFESGRNTIYRKMYNSKQYTKFIQYQGKFRDFNLHGDDGERIFYGQQISKQRGTFRNGSLVSEQNLKLSYVPKSQITLPKN